MPPRSSQAAVAATLTENEANAPAATANAAPDNDEQGSLYSDSGGDGSGSGASDDDDDDDDDDDARRSELGAEEAEAEAWARAQVRRCVLSSGPRVLVLGGREGAGPHRTWTDLRRAACLHCLLLSPLGGEGVGLGVSPRREGGRLACVRGPNERSLTSTPSF